MTDRPATLVLIPARMASTRLPGKPLMDIAGLPMIVQVLRRAEEAEHRPGRGRDRHAGDRRRRDGPWRRGGDDARRPPLRLGPDLRGAGKLDPDGEAEIVINVQGDLPTIPPRQYPRRAAAARRSRASTSRRWRPRSAPRRKHTNPSVVKAVGSPLGGAAAARAVFHPRHRALTATGRATIISASMPIAARRWSASSGCRPRRWSSSEKLEQLRALEAGMRIDVTIVDTVPLGVDTAADLETARGILSKTLSG